MCGRYQFSEDSSPTLAQIIRELGCTEFAGEIFPSAAAPVLKAEGGAVRPALLDWGFPIQGKRLVINARAETAAVKPLFRDSLNARRCVIPSSGFYEWDTEKRKYLFRLPDADTLYMAGIYDLREGRPRFCILTTAANDSMKEIHDRMPLILTKDQVSDWIFDAAAAQKLLVETPPELVKTAEDAQLQLW